MGKIGLDSSIITRDHVQNFCNAGVHCLLVLGGIDELYRANYIFFTSNSDVPTSNVQESAKDMWASHSLDLPSPAQCTPFFGITFVKSKYYSLLLF